MSAPYISWTSAYSHGGSHEANIASGLRRSKSALVGDEYAQRYSVETAKSRRKQEMLKRETKRGTVMRQSTSTTVLPSLGSSSSKLSQFGKPSIIVPSHGMTCEAEDVSPSLARLDKTVKQMGMNQFLASSKPLTADCPATTPLETESIEELESWMYTTLASLPMMQRRGSRHAKLPPMGTAPGVTTEAVDQEGNSVDLHNVSNVQEAAMSDAELPKKRRHSMRGSKPTGVPDVQILIDRMQAGEKGFTESELDRMHALYRRYIQPDSSDVHKDDLASISKRLGYLVMDDEQFCKIAEEVSVYSTMDFNEFVQYSQRCSEEEKSKFKEIFDKYDNDKSGRLDVNELRKLLLSLGFTPLQSMINEALEACDKDHDCQLDFEEFAALLAIYRYTEGFTEEQLDRLHAIFDDLSKAKSEIKADQLKDFLLKFFGPQMAEVAKKLGGEVVAGMRARESDDDPQPGLTFAESLIWARRVREFEFQTYREEFDGIDTGKTGFVKMEDIRHLVQRLGYTPSQKAIDELVASCKMISSNKMELDFDEFVHFFMLLRLNDGFEEKEVEEMKVTFERFDANGNGEIDILELSDMLRFMGYTTNLEELHRHINQVDFNDNGELDFREFLRLMRLHREAELRRAWKAFTETMNSETKLLSEKKLDLALSEINLGPDPDHPGAHPNDVKAIDWPEVGSELDFDAFVVLADQHRAMQVKRLRRCAGFSRSEIERFRQLFDSYDMDKSGKIEPKEIIRLLSDMGSSLNTREEQDQVLKELNDARGRAREVGIQDVGDGASMVVTFWVFIQLARSLLKRDDKRVLDRESRAIELAQFSNPEVEEFRQVFYNWVERDTFFDDENAKENDMEKLELLDEPKVLSNDALRRLLKSLGVTLSADQRTRLEVKLLELNPQAQGKVDFADFLGLMRWMLDTNFADIKGSAAKAAKT